MRLLILSTLLAASTLFLFSSSTTSPIPQEQHRLVSQTPAGKWQVDPIHSNVKFTVTHMVVSEVEGAFRKFDGTIEHSKPDMSDAKINFTVDVSSIDTDNEKRDN